MSLPLAPPTCGGADTEPPDVLLRQRQETFEEHKRCLFICRRKDASNGKKNPGCGVRQLSSLIFLSSFSFPLHPAFQNVGIYSARQGAYCGLLFVAGKWPSKLNPIPLNSSNLVVSHLHLPRIFYTCAE